MVVLGRMALNEHSRCRRGLYGKEYTNYSFPPNSVRREVFKHEVTTNAVRACRCRIRRY